MSIKRGVVLIIAFLLLGGLVGGLIPLLFLEKQGNNNKQISPRSGAFGLTATQAPTAKPCDENDLRGEVTENDNGKSINGELTVKNITSQTCLVNETDKFAIVYTDMLNNNNISIVEVTNITDKGSNNISINPNKTLTTKYQYSYSSLCAEGIHTVPIGFEYTFPDTNLIVFQDKNGKKLIPFPVCKSPSKISQIQIWKFTDSSLSQ